MRILNHAQILSAFIIVSLILAPIGYSQEDPDLSDVPKDFQADAQSLKSEIQSEISQLTTDIQGPEDLKGLRSRLEDKLSSVKNKLRTRLKKIFDEKKPQIVSSVKESIQQRQQILEELKTQLLENTDPKSRDLLAKEINRLRLESLKEIKDKIKDFKPEDIRAFEKEKLASALELCNQSAPDKSVCNKISETQERLNQLSQEELNKLELLRKKTDTVRKKITLIANSKDLKKFKLEEIEGELGEIKIEITAREIPEEKANEIRAELEKIDLNKLKLKLQQSKEDFLKLKNSEQGKLAAKEFLLNTLNFVLQRLEKTKLTIELEESLSIEEAQEESNKIDVQISQISNLKTKAEALDNNSPKSAYQDLAKEANKYLKEIKDDSEESSGFISVSRMGGILIKSANLLERLNKILEKLVLEQKDPSKAEALVSEFESQIDGIKSDFDSVQEKLKQSSLVRGSERSKLLKEAQNQLNELKSKLKNLHEKLKIIIKELNEKDAEVHLKINKADIIIEGQEKMLSGMSDTEIESLVQAKLDQELESKLSGITGQITKRIDEFRGPGGCTIDTCPDFCQDENNLEECVKFAVKQGSVSKEKAAEILSGPRILKGPGGCKNQAECESYCSDQSHTNECNEFNKKNGFAIREERIGPGGCRSREECTAYCSDPAHSSECGPPPQ